MLNQLTVAAQIRWRELRDLITARLNSDKGETPIGTIILWVGVAIILAGVVTWATTYVTRHEAKAPTP